MFLLLGGFYGWDGFLMFFFVFCRLLVVIRSFLIVMVCDNDGRCSRLY